MDELQRVNAALDSLYARCYDLECLIDSAAQSDEDYERNTATYKAACDKVRSLEERQGELINLRNSDAFWARVLGEAGVR